MWNKEHNELIDSFNKVFWQKMPYAPDSLENLWMKEYIKKKIFKKY